ncbi:hypothetical protein ACFO5K_06905 [Nocardia halotolerans]|uniref:Uncharacterized protein n=1 Tax=Nocardia halotolerans TaxID=1755878 RepID=A0ABV8VCV0_9NOCA
MQTDRGPAGTATPVIEPVEEATAGECRRLRIVAEVADARAWGAAADRLLACGRRRWRDRTDIADHPALRRWAGVQESRHGLEHPCLRTVFDAISADAEIAFGDPYADFAAAVMLLSSCPAEAIAQPVGEPRTVCFSVYAFREDDLPLAEDLITTTVRSCGIVVARRCTTVRRASAPRHALPLVDHPLPEPLVSGSTTAPR